MAATLDGGVSWVRYDGFLGSGAAYAAPALRFRTSDLTLGLRGSYLQFESGNAVVQGSFGGSWLTPALGTLQPEVTASGSVSRYAGNPTYGHLVGGARVHRAARAHGAWVGGMVGRSYFGGASSGAAQLEAGAWVAAGPVMLSGVISRTWFVDTAYLDAVAQVRWRPSGVELTGSAGLRAWSNEGGRGGYAEASATVPVSDWLALFASGGLYPSDLVRGVLAGRHLTGGVRISGLTFGGRRSTLPSEVAERLRDRARGSPHALSARLEILPASSALRTIRVTVNGCDRVEVMADFTDWRPMALTPASSGRFELALEIPPGVHRLNIRLDGGPWAVPEGARIEEDGFGGAVGVMLVR
jgi:hypothetical protein